MKPGRSESSCIICERRTVFGGKGEVGGTYRAVPLQPAMAVATMMDDTQRKTVADASTERSIRYLYAKRPRRAVSRVGPERAGA